MLVSAVPLLDDVRLNFCSVSECVVDMISQVLSVWSNDVATDLFLPYMVCTVATGILSTVSLHVICAH